MNAHVRQFHKYAPEVFESLGKDFPSHQHHEYKYDPRPIDLNPPISPREFKDRFYNICEKPTVLHRPWHSCRKFSYRTGMALTSIPKRTHIVEMGCETREKFWGIIAQEERCAAWVIFYLSLTVVPWIVFFFLWLFQWHHSADLQGASVPLSINISLIAIFIVLIYTDRIPV